MWPRHPEAQTHEAQKLVRLDPMKRALELARRAVGVSSPNPPVGAVVAIGGEIVGEGWTQTAGLAHAEIEALRGAGARARGAALYTTLEPCNHHGRTPPCTEAIIAAGISEVHASITDPSPRVAGRGIARLRAAGIAVQIGEGQEEAGELADPHAKYINTGLPFVTAKFAASLDGKIATRSGDSRWVTGNSARDYAHQLRAATDAVLVGIGTVLADDPRLTARDAAGGPLPRQPLRVIADSHGRLPPAAMLLAEPGKTLVAVAHQEGEPGLPSLPSLQGVDAEIFCCPGPDGRVDLNALIRELGRREITSLLVEGGGTLLGSLFDLGLVDKVVAFVAPVIIGGESAPSAVGGRGAERMSDAMRLSRVTIQQLGDDVAVIGYPARDS